MFILKGFGKIYILLCGERGICKTNLNTDYQYITI